MGDYFKFWSLLSNNKVYKYIVTSLILNELFKSEKSQSLTISILEDIL